LGAGASRVHTKFAGEFADLNVNVIVTSGAAVPAIMQGSNCGQLRILARDGLSSNDDVDGAYSAASCKPSESSCQGAVHT